MDFENLPDGWEQSTLLEVVSKLVDGSHNPPPKSEKGLPMLSARNIENGYINFTEDYRLVTQEDFERETKRTQVQEGDVLLTIVGAIGRSAVISKDVPIFSLQRSVAVFSPIEIDSYFLSYQFRSPKIQKYLIDNAKGTAQKGIYLNKLKKINLAIAPLNEQKRIVKKVEALSSHVRRSQEALEEVPKLIEQFRQSVLAAAFRGDLTADWRKQNPDVEPASVLLERIKEERRRKWEETELEKMRSQGKEPKNEQWKEKYKKPIIFCDFDDLPDIPDSWIWVNLDTICGKITDGEHLTPPTAEEGVYLLSAKDVRDGYLDFSDTKFVSRETAEKSRNRCNPETNDILVVSRGATVGRSCLITTDKVFCLMGSVLLFKLYQNFIHSKIVDFFFKSPLGAKKLISMSGASAQQAIYIRDMKNFLVAIPPIEEQKEIARKIENLFQFIDKIEKKIKPNLTEVESLNQSILAKAFRGELVTQDPNDEPASVLLERIRAEQAQPKSKEKASTQLQLDGID